MSEYSEGYNYIASHYDAFNESIDYGKWADYIDSLFRKHHKQDPVKTVLDLGCGTGKMIIELKKRGYDVIGLDSSDEMLSVADYSLRENGFNDTLLIHGDMAFFELYGSVNAIICCLDGINHICDPEDLRSCLSLVSNYLDNEGLFVFDLNTPYKFRTRYNGKDYILEDENAVCCWQSETNKNNTIAHFYLSVFEKTEDEVHWTRKDTYIEEKAYSLRSIKKYLSEAGLEIVEINGSTNYDPPDELSERWYITAKKVINIKTEDE